MKNIFCFVEFKTPVILKKLVLDYT